MKYIEKSIKVEYRKDNSKNSIGLAWISRQELQKVIETADSSNPERLFPVNKGDELIHSIKELVDSSKNIVCMSSFLIQETDITESLIEASKRGVRVYVLTSGEEDLKEVSDEDEDNTNRKERIENFKKLLNKLSDRVLVRTGSFHAKFLLVDPHDPKPKGIMATANFTKDALSGTNKELCIYLSKKEVQSFFNQFIKGFWKMSRHELIGGRLREFPENPYIPFKNNPDVIHPSTFIDNTSLYNEIKVLISEARNEISISAWTFSDDVEIPDLLLNAINRGVSVNIYTRPNYLNAVTLSKLKEKGARILAHERFHAKAIIVDRSKSLVTTANFSKLGLEEGFEVGISLNKNDTETLIKIFNEWDHECNWELSLSSEIGNLQNKVKLVDIDNKSIQEIEVKESQEVKLKDQALQEIKKKDEIDITKELPKAPDNAIFKKIKYTLNVILPELPNKDVKLDRQEGNFQLYRKNSSPVSFFVPVSKWEDLDAARIFARKNNASVVRAVENKN